MDFGSLARCDDNGVFNRFVIYSRNSQKRVFAKSVRYNAYKVEREPRRLTIRLLDCAGASEPRTAAFYSFVPTPDFSQRYVGT